MPNDNQHRGDRPIVKPNVAVPEGEGRSGTLTLVIEAEHLDKVRVEADEVIRTTITRPKFCRETVHRRRVTVNRRSLLTRRLRPRTVWDEFVTTERYGPIEIVPVIIAKHHNAYVNTGLNNALDREFGLGGTAIGFIGVSSNTTAVTAATVNLNGASGGTAANTIIKAISPAATRTSQTVTGGATFVNADFTSGVFIWNKLGFLTTSTDAGTGLVDVIGGTGGSSPYNRTFALDLTAAGTFSVTAQIAVSATAT